MAHDFLQLLKTQFFAGCLHNFEKNRKNLDFYFKIGELLEIVEVFLGRVGSETKTLYESFKLTDGYQHGMRGFEYPGVVANRIYHSSSSGI